MPACLPDQLDAGKDVAPLVRAAHLQIAAIVIVQHEVVVRLEQHVTEFRVRDALFAGHPGRHGLLGQHVVDGEVLADIPEEVRHPDLAQPVSVVDDTGGVGLDVKIQEMGELELDVLDVVVDLLHRQKLSLVVPTRRVADHAGSSPGDCNWRMSVPLHSHEAHDRDHVADVQAACGRVEPDVYSGLRTGQHVFHARCRVEYRSSPAQFFDDVHGANGILTAGVLCRVAGVCH